MPKRPHDVTANVRLLSTERGGRVGPTPANFFSCVLQIDKVNLSARLWLDETGPLHPGQEARVAIGFVDPGSAERHCAVGQSFALWEGRVIGSGTISATSFSHQDGPIARSA